MPATVALTGATGFIGGHLVPALERAGWSVRALVRRTGAALPSSVATVRGSVEDPKALAELVAGAGAVVHGAGLIKARGRADFFRVNAGGVAALAAAAAAQATAPRFVLLSSLAAREPALSDYAGSKRAGEAALAEAAPPLPWTVFRPAVVYGPGDREVLTLLRAMAKGLAPVLGAEHARVSMIHAEDLASAVVGALAPGNTAGRTYEIDDGRPGGYSWGEIVATAAEVLGRRVRIVRVPPAALRALAYGNLLAGRLSNRIACVTPGKAREILHPDWVCHDQDFALETGWRPRWPLREGLADTVAWYRAQGWL